jgi:hypothetical protein
MMKQIISIGKYIDCRTITKYGKVFTCYTVEFYGGSNVFNLKSNGDYAVMAVNEDDLSETSQEDSRAERKLATYKEHAPKFFIVHADGSGTELMRYQDVAEYVNNSEQSPATAVLRDDLPDYPGVTGITILKPYIGGRVGLILVYTVLIV